MHECRPLAVKAALCALTLSLLVLPTLGAEGKAGTVPRRVVVADLPLTPSQTLLGVLCLPDYAGAIVLEAYKTRLVAPGFATPKDSSVWCNSPYGEAWQARRAEDGAWAVLLEKGGAVNLFICDQAGRRLNTPFVPLADSFRDFAIDAKAGKAFGTYRGGDAYFGFVDDYGARLKAAQAAGIEPSAMAASDSAKFLTTIGPCAESYYLFMNSASCYQYSDLSKSYLSLDGAVVPLYLGKDGSNSVSKAYAFDYEAGRVGAMLKGPYGKVVLAVTGEGGTKAYGPYESATFLRSRPSPVGTAYAMLAEIGKKSYAVFVSGDGVERRVGPIDAVLSEPWGGYGNYIMTSPDGAHFGVIARIGGEEVLYLDGDEAARGESIPKASFEGGALACVAYAKDTGYAVVRGAVRFGPYAGKVLDYAFDAAGANCLASCAETDGASLWKNSNKLLDALAFSRLSLSSDGAKASYVFAKPRTKGNPDTAENFLAFSGKAFGPFGEVLSLERNATHAGFALVAKESDSTQSLWGPKGLVAKADPFKGVALSPSGASVAWIGESYDAKAKRRVKGVYLDGKKIDGFSANITDYRAPAFSADGSALFVRGIGGAGIFDCAFFEGSLRPGTLTADGNALYIHENGKVVRVDCSAR